MFAKSGEWLTRRFRRKTFLALIRQVCLFRPWNHQGKKSLYFSQFREFQIHYMVLFIVLPYFMVCSLFWKLQIRKTEILKMISSVSLIDLSAEVERMIIYLQEISYFDHPKNISSTCCAKDIGARRLRRSRGRQPQYFVFSVDRLYFNLSFIYSFF
jgi:hypothetical protein